MAERIVRQLIDDLDGSDIADGQGERVEFAVRGIQYRLDLSKNNVVKFDKALAPFLQKAAKVAASTKGGRRVRGQRRLPKAESAAVRAWAAKNGHKVSGRGRIPGDVMEAYKAAHRR